MSQPRVTEFIWIKDLAERWTEFELVDGNNRADDEYYYGGGPNG